MDRLTPEFGFLGRLLRPYRLALFLAVLLLMAESALMLATPWFAGKVMEALLAGKVPGRLLGWWFVVLAVQALVAFGNSVASGGTATRVLADLGGRVYDHLQSLPVAWHQARKRGEVLALLSSDVWRVSEFLTGTMAPLLPLLLTCVGALYMLMSIEPRIGLAVALLVPVYVLAIKLVTRRLRPLAERTVNEEAVKFGIAEQNLSTLPLIKAFARERLESSRYLDQSNKVRDLEIRQLWLQSALTPSVRWVSATGVLVLLWIGGKGVAAGTLSSANLVALLLYGMLLTQPVSQLASVYGSLQAALGSSARLRELLAVAREPDDGQSTIERVRGDIAFEGVAFGYPGRPPLFAALDLHIRHGETIALTGPNGAGKSTMAHLLMRFADPTGGRVTLDGVDLRDLSLPNLRSHIGLVSQQVLLLNASILENIGYGRFGASREDIEAAARAAHAHDFISRLPQGYDTVIGDEGIRLSGGQRQRLALARALLKDPAILILDEATAMFDPEGERGFIAECHDLLRERTVLLITHRPASLALADRVLRLEGGILREV